MADAATVAPFEYVGLPLAVFWGWVIWAELPDFWVSLGILLIMGSGLFVFLRERMVNRRLVTAKRVHRRY
jgi:S-adenosylmethionine uptake transporter